MIRLLFTIAGLCGAALMTYDFMQFPWPPDTFEGLDWRLARLSIFFGILLFFRFPKFSFLVASFWEAVQWRIYLGAKEIRIIWTDDLNPDAF
jgi:hypothetical protein